jgi:hypothetical protein
MGGPTCIREHQRRSHRPRHRVPGTTAGADNPLVRGDVTLVHYPNGGAVFSAASIVWSGGFFYTNYENDMTRITENVLNLFSSGVPLPAG